MGAINLLILSTLILIFPVFWKVFFKPNKISSEIKPGRRILFFDFLKGIAIIAVIIIHVIKVSLPFFLENQKNILYMANNILRFAVPFFFIISGILLTPDLKNFYKRKIARLLIPYAICTIIIVIYYQFDFLKSLKLFITGKASLPYYFFIVLFQFYLLYPLLVKLRMKKWFLQITFLISLACYLLPQTWFIYGIPFFGKYLFFFAYGVQKREYFLENKYNKKQIHYWIILITAFIVLNFFLPGIYYNVRLIYGIALFNLIFILKDKINIKNKLNSIITKFGQNSLWIFLTHYLVVLILAYSYKIIDNQYLAMLFILISSIICSYWLAILCKKMYEGLMKMLIKLYSR